MVVAPALSRRTLLASGTALLCGLGLRAPARAAAPRVVRVASTMADDTTPMYYAVRTGMFAKAGTDVQFSVLPTGSAVAEAVVTGAADVGKSSLVALMNAHDRGLPIVLVLPGAMYDANAPFAELVVAADSPVRSAQDLDGKLVGVPYLNDFNELVTRMWVDQHGGDSSTVKFIEVPNDAQTAAIVQHRIDAAVLQEPDLAEALATNHVRVLGKAYSAISTSFMFSAWFARRDWAARHAELLATFDAVAVSAIEETNAHPEATATMMADVTKIPLSVLRSMNRVKSATTMDPATIQPLIDASARYHLIPHGFQASAMIFSGAHVAG